MRLETCDVVHVVNQMRPGGIETMVVDIVRHSSQVSRIFSLEGNTDQLVASWPGIASIAGSIEGFDKPPGRVPALVLKIARRFRQLKPRAVFLHRLNPLLYGGLAARIARVPAIVHVEHDVWQYSDAGRRRLLELSTRMVGPVHFAVSPAIAEALAQMLPSPQIRIVPGGVDINRFCMRERGPARLALGLPAEAGVIGTAGRLEPVKGHRVLVAAMRELPNDTHVLIAGDGSERENLANLARELGVEARLRLLGHRDDLELILPAFDLFCLPSLGEGLPRVLMEAQAADIPVVASDVGSVRQAVDPATGRLVVAGNATELARALNASLAAPPAPGACRSYAATRFSIDRLVHEYDSIAAAPGSRARDAL
jgi:glycosyltransferase involved in cell wall biosynthesis